MNALPIRWKFALGSAALVGVVLLVFAAATYFNLYFEELEAVDLELDAAGLHIASLPPGEVQDRALEELVEYQPWLYAAVFDSAGREIRRSEALPVAIARTAQASAGIDTVHDDAGMGWRIKAFPHGEVTVALAYSLEEAEEIVRDLLGSFILSLPVVMLVAALGGWWISSRALASLREVTATAEGIRADQLHQRIPVPPARDEIRRLVDVLNGTLERLETRFEQAKRFSADASHELRTPLTIIDGEITRLLRTPDLPAAAEELALSIHEEVSRLERITEQILLLARFDAGVAALPRTEIAFSQLVREAGEDAELFAETNAVGIEMAIAPDVAVRGDATLLRRLVLNLLENAARHNRDGGRMRCTLQEREGKAVLTVGNTGPAIPADEQANLFRRFYRGDAARSRGGQGLGLSLCREIARAHGGTIELADSRDDWTEFRVILPVG